MSRHLLARMLSSFDEDQFLAALTDIAQGTIVFPQRFPAEAGKDEEEHTPITWIITTMKRRTDRALALIQLLDEQLNYPINACTFLGKCSPLALAVYHHARAVPIARYLLLRRNAHFSSPPSMKLLHRIVAVYPCEEMLEVLAQRPPPAILDEARTSRTEFPALRRTQVTVLHWAVYRLRPRIVQLLLEDFDADVSARDSEGATALDWIPMGVAFATRDQRQLHETDNDAQHRANEIRAFLEMWLQRRLALAMSLHSRLGEKSPLGKMPWELLKSCI